MTNVVVVTRHPALVQYLREKGLIPEGTPVYPHADADIVRGRNVIGVLPMQLAALAEAVTIVDLSRLPYSLRGKELSTEDLHKWAGEIRTYHVKEVL